MLLFHLFFSTFNLIEGLMKHKEAQDDGAGVMSIHTFSKLLEKRKQAEARLKTKPASKDTQRGRKPDKLQHRQSSDSLPSSSSLENGHHCLAPDARIQKVTGKRSCPELSSQQPENHVDTSHDSAMEDYLRQRKDAENQKEELARKQEQKQKQISELQSKLASLNDSKHELVLQLKQVLQLEENARQQQQQQQLAAAHAMHAQNGMYSPQFSGTGTAQMPGTLPPPLFSSNPYPIPHPSSAFTSLAQQHHPSSPHLHHQGHPGMHPIPPSPTVRPPPYSQPSSPAIAASLPSTASIHQHHTHPASSHLPHPHPHAHPFHLHHPGGMPPYFAPPPPPPPGTHHVPPSSQPPNMSGGTPPSNHKTSQNGSTHDDLEEGEREPSPPSVAPSPISKVLFETASAPAPSPGPGRPELPPHPHPHLPNVKLQQSWSAPLVQSPPTTPTMSQGPHPRPQLKLPSYAPLTESPRFAPFPSPLGASRMAHPPQMAPLPIPVHGRGRGLPRPGPYSGTQPPPPPQPPPPSSAYHARRPAWNSNS